MQETQVFCKTASRVQQGCFPSPFLQAPLFKGPVRYDVVSILHFTKHVTSSRCAFVRCGSCGCRVIPGVHNGTGHMRLCFQDSSKLRSATAVCACGAQFCFNCKAVGGHEPAQALDSGCHEVYKCHRLEKDPTKQRFYVAPDDRGALPTMARFSKRPSQSSEADGRCFWAARGIGHFVPRCQEPSFSMPQASTARCPFSKKGCKFLSQRAWGQKLRLL